MYISDQHIASQTDDTNISRYRTDS